MIESIENPFLRRAALFLVVLCIPFLFVASIFVAAGLGIWRDFPRSTVAIRRLFEAIRSCW